MKHMSVKLFVVFLAIAGGSSICTVSAQRGQGQRNVVVPENINGSAAQPAPEVRAYWTSERLASARVVDLRAGLTPLEVESFAAEPSVATEAAGPTVAVIPNNRNLLLNPSTVPAYEEETMAGEEIQPAAYGTSGLRYTNTRNVPFAASTDNAQPYRTIGKWFFTKPGAGNFVCSASVIGRRILVTAGHCLHSGNGSGTGWFSNFLFVPAYRAGAAPFGSWTRRQCAVTTTWFNGGGSVPNAAATACAR